jgi:branched-subunit amino acid aminotransferase/4-amino-4-deoxychorismate lyase
VEEGRWKLEELNGAEEIFLANARIGIKPVRVWKGKKLAGPKLAADLAERFWKESS